jgi:FKBP-type peptidyl-prolyl cis-trans isomerase FkpA
MMLPACAALRCASRGSGPRCHLGFLSGLQGLFGGKEPPREYPKAGAQAEAPTTTGLHRQRQLEEAALQQRQEPGDAQQTGNRDALARGLLNLGGSIQGRKLEINAEGVQTIGGNEAWAHAGQRSLPGLPSKQDFGRTHGDAVDSGVLPGALDATAAVGVLREARLLGLDAAMMKKMLQAGCGAKDCDAELWAKLEQLALSSGVGDVGALVALLAYVSPVSVLMGGVEGEKRLGVLEVPAAVIENAAIAAAGGDPGTAWRISPEMLMPAAPQPDVNARVEQRYLTDAQRAFAGLGPMDEGDRGVSRRNQAKAQQQKQQALYAESVQAGPPKLQAAVDPVAQGLGLPWQRHVVSEQEQEEMKGARTTCASGLVVLTFEAGSGPKYTPKPTDQVEVILETFASVLQSRPFPGLPSRGNLYLPPDTVPCLQVHYVGRLLETEGGGETFGAVFDSSVVATGADVQDGARYGGRVLSVGALIRGWREGLSMMRVGGKARFIVPAALGYGAMGTDDGRVPPDAMISFDVELLRVESMS